MDWSKVELPGIDQDTVAVVLGGGGAIGKESVHALAAQGARVALVTRSEQRSTALTREIKEPHAVKPFAADLEHPASLQTLAVRVAECCGPPSLLVNSAAVGAVREHFTEVPLRQARKMMDVNVLGAFEAAKSMTPYMKQRGSGKIVNVASVAAERVLPGGTAYGVSKAALIALTRHLAVELGPDGITANSVSPGQTPTRLRSWNEEPGKTPQPPSSSPYSAQSAPAGRRGTLADYVGAILFLGSSLADYITGVDLPVEGGARLVRATAY